MNLNTIREHVRCCACRGPVRRLNLVELTRQAQWPYPTAGNLIANEAGRAVAVLCDACLENGDSPTLAVEFRSENVAYHPVESLPEMPYGYSPATLRREAERSVR